MLQNRKLPKPRTAILSLSILAAGYWYSYAWAIPPLSGTTKNTPSDVNIRPCKVLLEHEEDYEVITNWKVTNFLGPVAVFKPGKAKRMAELLPDLKKQGIEAVMIHDPLQSDLDLLKDHGNFLYTPTGITWKTPFMSFADRF